MCVRILQSRINWDLHRSVLVVINRSFAQSIIAVQTLLRQWQPEQENRHGNPAYARKSNSRTNTREPYPWIRIDNSFADKRSRSDLVRRSPTEYAKNRLRLWPNGKILEDISIRPPFPVLVDRYFLSIGKRANVHLLISWPRWNYFSFTSNTIISIIHL